MKRCSEIVLLTVVLAAAVMFAGCGGGEVLPDYVSRMSSGSVQIDVAKASGGSAQVDEESMNIIYDCGDYELMFSLGAFAPLTHGIGLHTSLSNPPLKISPVITPGDDVADFFAAVRIDEKTGDLYVTVFMDTDWQEVVMGEILIHTQEFSFPLPFQYTVETVDFSKAVDGVYMHELRFAAEASFGDYGIYPIITVTNITINGEPEDLIIKIARLELSMDDFCIYISPQVVKP